MFGYVGTMFIWLEENIKIDINLFVNGIIRVKQLYQIFMM